MKYLHHIRPIPFLITLVLALTLVSGALAIKLAETSHLLSIDSFQKCQAAGFPILEIYPEICVTSDGRQFTNQVNAQLPPDYLIAPPNPFPVDDFPIPVEPDYPIGGPTEPAEEFSPPFEGDDMVACTMEAKECPDGSFVGRRGPNCEFTACPGE